METMVLDFDWIVPATDQLLELFPPGAQARVVESLMTISAVAERPSK